MDNARKLYRNIGWPSEAHFQHILNNNLTKICPLTAEDAKRALKIYGPEEKTLKGKTTKKKESMSHCLSHPPFPVTSQMSTKT